MISNSNISVNFIIILMLEDKANAAIWEYENFANFFLVPHHSKLEISLKGLKPIFRIAKMETVHQDIYKVFTLLSINK